MPLFTDQLHRTISLPALPARIVSLVPSQTELLADLGLNEEVVGITKFCVHPRQSFREKQRIGGTKTVALEKVKSLQPDLILASKEENVSEQVEALAAEFPVWVSDVNNLADACAMILQVGALTGKRVAAQEMAAAIQQGFAALPASPLRPRVAYLIWNDPYMTVGSDTFIHDLLERAGLQNVFSDRRRYPVITVEDIRKADCQCLLLSSEPYPFAQKHVQELAAALPGTHIQLVDGELFSWYGSRLLKAAAYLKQVSAQVARLV